MKSDFGVLSALSETSGRHPTMSPPDANWWIWICMKSWLQTLFLFVFTVSTDRIDQKKTKLGCPGNKLSLKSKYFLPSKMRLHRHDRAAILHHHNWCLTFCCIAFHLQQLAGWGWKTVTVHFGAANTLFLNFCAGWRPNFSVRVRPVRLCLTFTRPQAALRGNTKGLCTEI